MSFHSAKIQTGDVYCVFCLEERLSMRLERGDEPTWECDGCGRVYEHPFHADDNGRFAWTWDAKHPQPNAGCPWCGTCNLSYSPPIHGLTGQWRCRRESCRKFWRGRYELHEIDGQRSFRWTIHVPVGMVPWASGTAADLECYRRRASHAGLFAGEYNPACCWWPKSCSAFDPGFTVGKGPTTLPLVWFDGFGWRSGPPDPKTIPNHLFSGMQIRWAQRRFQGSLPMTSPEEANDDDGDDGEAGGCGEADCNFC